MPSVDASSLREEFDAVNEHIASLRQAGKISGEADAAIGVLCSLLSILIVVFLEKTTKKTGKNSSIPPSQTDKDETKKRRNSGKGMPDIPPNPKGRRGKVAKSDAHNLHERLLKYEDCVLRFMSEPDVSFTNNEGERKIRMAKVKMKVSGCFRTERYAHAWCRISSYLSSMAALGYAPGCRPRSQGCHR